MDWWSARSKAATSALTSIHSTMLSFARELNATPYDIHGVELTQDGELCSFDSFLNKYNLDEPELRYLALIRGADTDRHDLTAESGGLFAISLGLSDLHPGDDQAVRRDELSFMMPCIGISAVVRSISDFRPPQTATTS